jgi:D-tyrosyl-tRNA(Tyr) deacylase
MRAVVQRVLDAGVSVEGEQIARIGVGLLVLLGVTRGDSAEGAQAMARKLAGLRILRDSGRDESSSTDVDADVLVVSQFTLYGDTSSGRRPSWAAAAPAVIAEPLVDAVVDELRNLGLSVQTGRFGATMVVSSTNDGPMTLLVEVP